MKTPRSGSTTSAQRLRLSALGGVVVHRRFVVCTLALLLVAGCASGDQVRRAETAVARFHELYNHREFNTIWAEASGTLHEATSESTWVKNQSGVFQRMGPVLTTVSRGSLVMSGRKGTRVRVAYETNFENGILNEEFGYVVVGDSLRLEGYSIQERTSTGAGKLTGDSSGE